MSSIKSNPFYVQSRANANTNNNPFLNSNKRKSIFLKKKLILLFNKKEYSPSFEISHKKVHTDPQNEYNNVNIDKTLKGN